MKLTREQIIQALKAVKDPEIGIDLWTLGLIYDIKIAEDGLPAASEDSAQAGVDILMTLTSPFCPFGNEIVLSVEEAIKKLGAGEVKVDITFDPPWQPSRELRKLLGI